MKKSQWSNNWVRMSETAMEFEFFRNCWDTLIEKLKYKEKNTCELSDI